MSDDPKRLGVPDVDADAVRESDQAAGLPPALIDEADAGPKLNVEVVELTDVWGETTGAFAVLGTRDEALARRLIRQHVADEYGTEDGPALAKRLDDAPATLDTFRWVEPEHDTEEPMRQLVPVSRLSPQLDGFTFTLPDLDE